MSGWFALACWAAAAGGPAAPEGAGAHLALRIAAPPAVTAALEGRLGPRLAALGVALDVTAVPEVNLDRVLEVPPEHDPAAPLARGWLDARNIDGAVLLLIPRRADRVLVRRVPLTLGVDEAGLAQLAFIIERSMASLLASEPIGVPPAEARAALSATPPGPKADAVPAEARQRAVQVGAFAGLASWSSNARLVPRIGLDVWFDWISDATRVGVAGSAAVDPAFRSRDANGDLLVRAASLHAWVTAGREIGTFGVGRVAVGPALLVTHVTPSLASPSPAAIAGGGARTDLDPMLAFLARWDLRLGRSTTLFLAATVDLVPLRVQYVTTVADGTGLFSPWLARPALVLGVSFGSQSQRP